VYYQEAVIRLPVERNRSGPLALTLKVTSQGCADAGICYPPQQQSLSLQLADPPSLPAAAPAAPASDAALGDESGRIAQLFRHTGFWLLVGSFFGFGLLLSLTPCVFPMIPILSSIIVGSGRDGHALSHLRGFALSLAYVLGMAVTYAAAGIAAGLTGTLLAVALQNPWVLGSFAAVFVLLSLSMFGFYELQLPTFLQSRVSEEAQPPARRLAARRGGDGRAVGDDRRPLRRRAAGRRPALHRPDWRRGARWRSAVRHGAGHGRAAACGRTFGRYPAAALWPVDGGGEKGLRRAPAGHRGVAGGAGDSGGGADAGLGLAADRTGHLPARARSAAAARPGLATILEGHRHRHAAGRCGDVARHAGRLA
jgi:hypothetical protein